MIYGFFVLVHRVDLRFGSYRRALVWFFFCPRAWTWLLDRSVDVLIVCDDYSKCFWSCMPFLVLLEYHERGFRTACQKV